MAKMTGKQGLKICDALREIMGDSAADDFAEKLPLSSSADYIRKFRWAGDVCKYFESNFTTEDIKRIRMACSCEPPAGKLNAAKAMFEAAPSPEEFCAAFNREFAPDNSVEYADGAYYFSYPRCFCSAVARADGTLPAVWCLCSLGYVKKLFDGAFGRDTGVELLESVKTGGTRCVFRITVN